MTRHRKSAIISAALVIAFMAVSGCNSSPKFAVESYVEGTLKVRAEVDSSSNYAGFRISVLSRTDGDVDTLGTAVTDRSGAFSMNVRAAASGVYPMVVERTGYRLSIDDLVVVDGDSARVTGLYPLGPAGLRVVSSENAAWSAYKNAKASHNQQMLSLMRSRAYTPQDVGRITAQTSSVLWSVPSAFPGTIGGELSMAESVVMMEGWSDSTVLARLPLVSATNASIVEVVRAARRSKARIAGQDSALALLDYYLKVTLEAKHPEIMAEKVIAYSDSFQTQDAIRIATELKKKYPDSEWATWAGRATYELENLQPGMNAPAFSVVTRENKNLSTASLKGKFVILEFYDPSEQIFQREFVNRDLIADELDERVFATVSISVEPDSVVNEAIFDGMSHPGHFVWLPTGMESKIVRDFNVQILPTRYLLDPSGQIVTKYTGPGIAKLEEDLASIVTGLNGITEVPVLKKVN
mgnify:CR=1 FL=1